MVVGHQASSVEKNQEVFGQFEKKSDKPTSLAWQSTVVPSAVGLMNYGSFGWASKQHQLHTFLANHQTEPPPPPKVALDFARAFHE